MKKSAGIIESGKVMPDPFVFERNSPGVLLEKVPYNISRVEVSKRVIFFQLTGEISARPFVSPVLDNVQDDVVIAMTVKPGFPGNNAVIQPVNRWFRQAPIVFNPEINCLVDRQIFPLATLRRLAKIT